MTGGGRAGTGGGATAAPKGTALASRPGPRASHPKPAWFQSLEMTSATSGWALVWSANPGVIAGDARILLARTTDGARTWSDVTPAAARPMLATVYSFEALDPVDGEHAYLAVSRATSDNGGPVSTTAVFATADGGRTWTESAVFRTSDPVARLSFADASHGWLLLDSVFHGPGQPETWLYGTSDGGRRWLPAAAVAPPGNYGMNSFCEPRSLTFLTVATGWISDHLPGAGRVPGQPRRRQQLGRPALATPGGHPQPAERPGVPDRAAVRGRYRVPDRGTATVGHPGTTRQP